MNDKKAVEQKERLFYKKCCNYACECNDDGLRKVLGDIANGARVRLGESADNLTNG